MKKTSKNFAVYFDDTSETDDGKENYILDISFLAYVDSDEEEHLAMHFTPLGKDTLNIELEYHLKNILDLLEKEYEISGEDNLKGNCKLIDNYEYVYSNSIQLIKE